VMGENAPGSGFLIRSGVASTAEGGVSLVRVRPGALALT